MMMPIEWHENNLVNMRLALEDALAGVVRAADRRDRLQAEMTLLERQIAEAKRRGLFSFDCDRMLKKRAADG